MKQLVCEMCGGNDLIKQDGVFVCQNCKTKYSVEEAKKMMVETDDSKFSPKCEEPQSNVENIESPQPENVKEQKAEVETKPENIFADIEPEKKNIGKFLIKPLAPKGFGGCGCVPGGCLPAFVTTPIFIAFAVIYFLFIIICAVKADNAVTPEQKEARKRQSEIEELSINARVALAQSIKANLREPKSYDNITIDVYNDNEYIWVKNIFRGKNRYSGYEECTFVARFKFDTQPEKWKITEWEITNKPSSNSGCRAIMTALP